MAPGILDAEAVIILRIIEINFPNPDWILIRQALSMSLLKNIPITIGGGAVYIAGNPEFRPIFDDMARMADEFGAGRLLVDSGSIIFEPQPLHPGKFRFDSGPLSPAVELLLFMMPSLFQCDFRSILELSGVTHSPLSCPTAFVKETILAALELMGLYGSLTLRRFGFHGSGGGDMESRLYPREQRSGMVFSGTSAPSLGGVKIFISRLDTGLAELEKSIIADNLGLDTNRIAIIEVMESDGAGNGIQVFAECRGLPVVLFREMRIYGSGGEPVFSEDVLRGEIAGIAGEARLLMEGTLPERVVRELHPYCILSGNEPAPAGDSPRVAMTRELCEKLL